MSEFKVHYLVKCLVDNLKSDVSPDNYVGSLCALLTEQGSSQTSVKQAIKCLQSLAKKSPNADKLFAKYNQLDSKNVASLYSLVQLLFNISEDPKLMEYLATNNWQSMANDLSSLEPSSCLALVPEMSAAELLKHCKHLQDSLAGPLNMSPHRKGPSKTSVPDRTPTMSDWYTMRPYLVSSFALDTNETCPFAAQLGPIPIQSQESLVIEDVLLIMEAIEGDYIVVNPSDKPYEPRTFSISDGIDPSLREVIKDMLPMGSYFSIVSYFTHEYSEYARGRVNHALVAAMKHILREYSVLVGQLEKMHRAGTLNLQLLWYYVQPMLASIRMLSEVAVKIHLTGAKGGSVLSLLHGFMSSNSGDAKLHQECLYLLQAAAVPYMEILEAWVYTGVIRDVYQEFLVEDDESKMAATDKDFWEKRYTICQEKVPVFLQEVSGLILRTGKYLNVIHQCRVTVKCPRAEPIVYSVSERPYVEAIENAYTFASQTLLEMILKDYDLVGRLRSIKHYFLMDQGDFIVQLIDCCANELHMSLPEQQRGRLQTLFELTLRTSAAKEDKYHESMGIALEPNTIYQQLRDILSVVPQPADDWHQETERLDGYKAFTFDYTVEWPVSLVLNSEAVRNYKLIFRTLFYCKHVEHALTAAWMDDKGFKLLDRATGSNYTPAFALRQRMLNCIQNVEYYMMAEVVEPNWQAFLNKLKKVTYIDDVLDAHTDFLHTCMNDCMMSSLHLLTAVSKLMSTCMAYCQFVKHMRKYNLDAERTSMLQTSSDDSSDGETERDTVEGGDGLSYSDSIDSFDQRFSDNLSGLMNRINERGRESNNEKLITLLYRLDFNNYYTTKLGQVPEVKKETSG